MNPTKSLLGIVAMVVPSSSVACNYTDGGCYPRGQGDGTVDTGGGVGSTGTGNPGDAPQEQSQGDTESSACNTPEPGPGDDGPVESSLKVFCKKPDWGPTCSTRCNEKGLGCVPFAVHPKKPDGGTGKLFSCNTLTLGFMCGYHYPNGDDCYYALSSPFPTLCSYSGND